MDFSKTEVFDELTTPEEEVILTPTPANKNSVPVSQATCDAFTNHPLNRGTPLTIKKSKVARI